VVRCLEPCHQSPRSTNARRPQYNDASRKKNPRKDKTKRMAGELIVKKILGLPRRLDQVL